MRQNRWLSLIVVMVVVASGLLSPLGSGVVAAQNATSTPRSGSGDGGSYESPTYGYSLSYDAVVWTVSAEDPEPGDGYDQIGLTNGISFITLIGTPNWTADQLPECVEDYADFRTETDGITEFEPVASSDESDDESASNLYTYVYNDGEFTEYIECRDLNGTVVIILHDVSTAAYRDEVDALGDLLDGLEPGEAREVDPTATPRGSRTPVSMGTPTKEETPAESEPGVYVSPTYGYQIPYGDEDWTAEAEDSGDDIDTFEMSNGVSVVTFTGTATNSDADECLTAAVASLLDERAFRDFNQAVTSADEPYEGTAVIGPYTGYTDGDTAAYLECGLSPDGDVALLVRVVAPLADFGSEIGPISEILEKIVWDDAGSGDPRLTATPDDEESTPTEDETPGAGESDTSYTDDTNQWSLTWEDPWVLTSDPEEDGLVILDDEVSLIYFYVVTETDDALDCVRDQVVLMTDDENVSDVNRLRIDDKTVRGGDETAAFAGYTYTYTGDNGAIDMVTYFDCRVLPSGEETLLSNQIVIAEAYEDEADAVATLLEGLTIGKGAEPEETPRATRTPIDEEPATNDENAYTSETYGYSISWDEDVWTREDTDDEDILELTNGVSTVTLLPYADGDALECVDGSFRLLSRDIDDLEQANDTEGKPLAGGSATRAFGVYVGTDSSGDRIAVSFYCISLDADASVVLQHQTTSAAYNDEIEARSTLLGALILPD